MYYLKHPIDSKTFEASKRECYISYISPVKLYRCNPYVFLNILAFHMHTNVKLCAFLYLSRALLKAQVIGMLIARVTILNRKVKRKSNIIQEETSETKISFSENH